MGKSTSGPDLTDCVQYLRQIETHHKVSVTLLLTASGSHGGIPLSCVALATPDKLVEATADVGWSCERKWPHRSHRTFEGCVYGLLMQLDEILTSGRWEQASHPA